MTAYTKTAAEVFAPTTGGGAPRGAVMGEAQTWGTEIENAIADVRDEVATYQRPIVLVFSGQSNMANRYSYTWKPEPNLFYSTANFDNGGAGTFGPVPENTQIGCALATANEIAKRNPTRPVWVVNVSRSSSPISYWLTGGAVDVYGPLKAAVEQLLTHLGLSEIDQFFWWQGENDAFDANQHYPGNFEELYERLVAETWFPDTTPITIMAVSTFYQGGNGPILRAFNNQLRQVVFHGPATRRFVDTSKLAEGLWLDSGLHLNAAGHVKAGKLAALVTCEGIGQASAIEYIAKKFEQEARTSTTTLVQDRALAVYLRPDRSYSIEIYVAGLMHESSDFKFSLSGPGASIRQGHAEIRDPELDTPLVVRFAGGYLGSTTLTTGGYGAFELVIRATVLLPTEAGFLRFNWAQNTSTADATRVWGSSYIKMIEAA